MDDMVNRLLDPDYVLRLGLLVDAARELSDDEWPLPFRATTEELESLLLGVRVQP